MSSLFAWVYFSAALLLVSDKPLAPDVTATAVTLSPSSATSASERTTVELDSAHLSAFQRQLQELAASRHAQLSLRQLTLQEQQLQLEVRVARLQLQNVELQNQVLAQLQIQQQQQVAVQSTQSTQSTQNQQTRQRLEQALRGVTVVAVMTLGEEKSARLRVNTETNGSLRTVRDGDRWLPGVRIRIGSSWVDFVYAGTFQRLYLEPSEARR